MAHRWARGVDKLLPISTCADSALFFGLKDLKDSGKILERWLCVALRIGVSVHWCLAYPHTLILALGVAVQLPPGAGCEAMEVISKQNATCKMSSCSIAACPFSAFRYLFDSEIS